MEKPLDYGIFVEREYFRERSSWARVLGERDTKSDAEKLCCELIYAVLARANESSFERPDTTSDLARAQNAKLQVCHRHRRTLKRKKSRSSEETLLSGLQ